MNRKNAPLLILIFVALVIFMLTSCDRASTQSIPQPQNNELSKDAKYYNLQVEEYTYEGCQYILVGVGKSQWGSHKGNCSNPIHER
jgi:nitrous oxide reductase accessory protein NosL